MNPMLHLTFVYFPETDDEPVIITEAQSPVVPRIGDTIVLDEEEAAQKGTPNAWEVIDVFFQLPKSGLGNVITKVTVYIDPSEDEDEE